jgi:lysophospholipase L1-like esterase
VVRRSVVHFHLFTNIQMDQHTYSYLALGDSYTIGEGLAISESFPYQAVQLLRQSGYAFCAPEIVAKTGWTTDELLRAVSNINLQTPYDFVSVLIGVNNQYRGRSAEEYATQFETILQLSITYSDNNPSRVFVLSIPDWGATPFAEDQKRKEIAEAVDEFNLVNKKITFQYSGNYIDITPGTRETLFDNSLLTSDHLHPSAKLYARWAAEISGELIRILRTQVAL